MKFFSWLSTRRQLAAVKSDLNSQDRFLEEVSRDLRDSGDRLLSQVAAAEAVLSELRAAILQNEKYEAALAAEREKRRVLEMTVEGLVASHAALTARWNAEVAAGVRADPNQAG